MMFTAILVGVFASISLVEAFSLTITLGYIKDLRGTLTSSINLNEYLIEKLYEKETKKN